MYKIIGVDEREYGPVSEEQLRQWLTEQRVNGRTKVQRVGNGGWELLSTLPEFGAHFRSRGPWTCPKCGETIEAQFDSCWRCATPLGQAVSSGLPPTIAPARAESATDRATQWRVEYEMFRGTFATWDDLFDRAAEFATNIGRDRLIGISHSEDKDDGVVTVWYWTQEPEEG